MANMPFELLKFGSPTEQKMSAAHSKCLPTSRANQSRRKYIMKATWVQEHLMKKM